VHVAIHRSGCRSCSLSYWLRLFRVVIILAGPLFALFTFSYSALVISGLLYVMAGLGVTVGYHRLLTHRSFQTPKVIEYFFTVLGCLANQGGPLSWVAAHRVHHTHADLAGDPHSPRDGFWWAHILWLLHFFPSFDDATLRLHYVPDLASDPIHRFLERAELLLQLILAGLLFWLGDLWADEGLSWAVWGMLVRIGVSFQVTALVNSATHRWGYRSFAVRDDSTNLWWVAWLTGGEGWHNNHHAFPRSARHGLRWWEVDATFTVIRMLGFLGLARNIRLPAGMLCQSPPKVSSIGYLAAPPLVRPS